MPITSALLKTIKKRHYIAKDPDLTLTTAQKGLTLISVGLYNEEKIQAINELHEFFDGATFTSPKDMKQLTKYTAKLPDTTERFLEQVKVFANVLSALFTNACPLFIHIKEIIEALMEYKSKKTTSFHCMDSDLANKTFLPWRTGHTGRIYYDEKNI